VVPTTEKFQEILSPKVTGVGWTWVGKKDVAVSVAGENFFSDTKVLMGGKTFDATNGLRIKSEKAFDLTVDGGTLSDAVIQGRYGNAKPLLKRQDSLQPGLMISRVIWPPPADGFSSVEVYLKRDWEQDFRLLDLPRQNVKVTGGGLKPDDLLDPQITFNGVLITGPFYYDEFHNGKCYEVLLRFEVSAESIKKPDGMLTIRYPFHGARWSASYPMRDRNKIYSLARLQTFPIAGAPGGAPGDEWIYLAVTDTLASLRGTPDLNVSLLSGSRVGLEETGVGNCAPETDRGKWKESFCRQDDRLAILRLKASDLGEELLLAQKSYTARVAVPPKKKEPEVAKKNPQVDQYDSVWFPIDSAYATIAQVKADGETLEKREKGSTSEVLLTRKLTEKPGAMDLIVTFTEESKEKPKIVRLEIVCKECQQKEKK
jgi:hypothetical protein